ncbi:hypothetical protein [Flavisolibacter nicotianae]|uniref:hypothetical protein n=1 Tax=Flavisolibacter nicotianae TaxID=2364882 RepID=UPI000EB48E2A|nr:hypothetical protein [Flavisolibacter nicotianae]
MGSSQNTRNSIEVFQHGEHNEEVCDLLNVEKKYRDWIITTAFYASLHFVSCKIFPFKHPIKASDPIEIKSIEEWQRFKNYASNKRHDLLAELVSRFCTDISEKYDWLLSTAKTSRYHQFQYGDVQISDLAVSYMKAIKKSCQPKVKK